MKLSYAHYAAVALVLSASAAQADAPTTCCRPDKSWYVAFSGGVGLPQPTDYTHPDFTTNGSTTNRDAYKAGYEISGAVGYKVLSGVRTELEVTERQNDVKNPVVDPNAPPNAYYAAQSTAIMANGYIDLHNDTSYTPYFGVGVGEADVDTRHYYTFKSGPINALITSGGSNKMSGWGTAYQFMAGVNYETSAGTTPIEINLGYRYFATQDIKDTARTNLFSAPVSFSTSSHNIELGLRAFFSSPFY